MKAFWKFVGYTLEWITLILFWIVVAPLILFLVINYLGVVGLLFVIVFGFMSVLYGINILLQWIFGHRDEEEKENPDDWFV